MRYYQRIPPFHPLLVKLAFSKDKKKRKVGDIRSSRAAAEADDEEKEDDKDVDSPPTQSQYPFSSRRMEEDLAAIWRSVWGASAADTSQESEMIRWEIAWEKKNLEREHLMARM